MKLGIAGFAVTSLATLAVIATIESKRRAKLHHCRNNCRKLGEIGSNEFLAGKVTMTGRLFWHQVRFLTYSTARQKEPAESETEEEAKDCPQQKCRNPRHEHLWKPIWPDPFICPLQSTHSDREDPGAIDYRGPRAIPTRISERMLIGADRPGNHPDGSGFVIFSDRSIKEGKFEVMSGGAGIWKQAETLLGD